MLLDDWKKHFLSIYSLLWPGLFYWSFPAEFKKLKKYNLSIKLKKREEVYKQDKENRNPKVLCPDYNVSTSE